MIGVIVPTVAGREQSLERTLAAYHDTLSGYDYEIETPRNFPSWPSACNDGTIRLAEADILHYGADDLVPVGDWLSPCLPVLAANELPAPRVWNYEQQGEPWSRPMDGEDGNLTAFTRVPILTAAMAGAIGPWPEIIYYADAWVSDKARSLGWPSRVVAGYDFVHHWEQPGRLSDDVEAMDDARARYLAEIERL